MPSIVLVHNLTRDTWYFRFDGDPRPITLPEAQTRDQLRYMLAAFDFAVNGPVVEVTDAPKS